jgi:hypothetical protein
MLDARSHPMLTAFGVAALTFMMVMYALERRGRPFVLGFAAGCALSSTYGFISGAWPFGVIEAIWCAIVIRRFLMDWHRSIDG